MNRAKRVSASLWLAIEGGGSSTRSILATPKGRVLSREAWSSSSPLYIEPARFSREARAAFARMRRAADREGLPVRRVGLAAPMNRRLVISLVRGVFPGVRFTLLEEGDVALALYDLDWGMSLVAGTGSSCRYVGPDGTRISAGGFGPQFGDEGSGYWIGGEAVSAVLRADEGTGAATRLSKDLPASLDLSTMTEILRRCDRSGHVPAPMVAGCVPVVARAAAAGDAVARGILESAAGALGELVLKTARLARCQQEPVPLVLTGGLFHMGGLLLRPLRRTLRGSGIRFRVFPPVPDPIEGIIRAMHGTGSAPRFGARRGG